VPRSYDPEFRRQVPDLVPARRPVRMVAAELAWPRPRYTGGRHRTRGRPWGEAGKRRPRSRGAPGSGSWRPSWRALDDAIRTRRLIEFNPAAQPNLPSGAGPRPGCGPRWRSRRGAERGEAQPGGGVDPGPGRRRRIVGPPAGGTQQSILITARETSYRMWNVIQGENQKESRLNPRRRNNIVRHELFFAVFPYFLY